MITQIAAMIIDTALRRQRTPKQACSDLVAAMHAVWIEVGLELGKEMNRIREEERKEEGSQNQ